MQLSTNRLEPNVIFEQNDETKSLKIIFKSCRDKNLLQVPDFLNRNVAVALVYNLGLVVFTCRDWKSFSFLGHFLFLLLVKLSFVFGSGFLVLLVFGHKIVHV